MLFSFTKRPDIDDLYPSTRRTDTTIRSQPTAHPSFLAFLFVSLLCSQAYLLRVVFGENEHSFLPATWVVFGETTGFSSIVPYAPVDPFR
ncbi:hypothetical protein L6452_18095 [Arctium lappa]|uniref:Uncharacterized protein n=1 Tax=Arctium lappa TaxID=4217 RepID=A0ACB9C538_ARCLA|nr:hypothetical protein L6452_18095 [Arctium lappa]